MRLYARVFTFSRGFLVHNSNSVIDKGFIDLDTRVVGSYTSFLVAGLWSLLLDSSSVLSVFTSSVNGRLPYANHWRRPVGRPAIFASPGHRSISSPVIMRSSLVVHGQGCLFVIRRKIRPYVG